MIYDNGTESGLLLDSLQRALNRDEAGWRIVDIALGHYWLIWPMMKALPLAASMYDTVNLSIQSLMK